MQGVEPTDGRGHRESGKKIVDRLADRAGKPCR